MPRLFAGIALPEEARETIARLKAPLPGARWVEAGNLHLTLRFAGDIGNLTASEFADGLAHISAGAFTLRIVGLGAFGGNAPALLWAGVEANPALSALQRATERAARNAGLPPERHGFKPHITVARLRYARDEAVARYLERHARFSLDPVFISHFSLFSSRPQTGGGPYVEEETYPLYGGGIRHGAERDETW